MTAYLINHLRIPGGTPREEGLAYLEQVEETVRPFGGKWLAQGDVEVVEGAWPGSVVLTQFPTIADARKWYNSASYQRILHLRTDNVISDLIFVEGPSNGFSVADFARKIRVATTERRPAQAIALYRRVDTKV